jgi:alpha-glucoside transport system substrate-binding protein
MAAIPPGSWCLGLSEPSAPGWPGTDWVEDLLLHRAGRDNYQAWASGDLKWTSGAVRAAFQEFRENYVAGPATLLASPTEAASDLVNGRKCTAMHQSSFYAQGGSVPYQMPRSEPGVEVSGDFAARFTANPAAETLLKDLTDPGSALVRDWVARSRGMVFPLTPQPELYTGDRRRVANLFTAGARCMDASDAMPPAVAPAELTEILGRLQKVQAAVSKDEKLEVYCSTGAA